MRCFAVPRGIAILAGGTAGPRDRSLTVTAEPGELAYGPGPEQAPSRSGPPRDFHQIHPSHEIAS